jgi:hypothetical protein
MALNYNGPILKFLVQFYTQLVLNSLQRDYKTIFSNIFVLIKYYISASANTKSDTFFPDVYTVSPSEYQKYHLDNSIKILRLYEEFRALSEQYTKGEFNSTQDLDSKLNPLLSSFDSLMGSLECSFLSIDVQQLFSELSLDDNWIHYFIYEYVYRFTTLANSTNKSDADLYSSYRELATLVTFIRGRYSYPLKFKEEFEELIVTLVTVENFNRDIYLNLIAKTRDLFKRILIFRLDA